MQKEDTACGQRALPPWPAGASLLFLLIFTFAACGGSTESNARSLPPGHSTTTPNTSSATSTAQVMLGRQPCPAVVSAPSHWDSIIGTQNGVSRIEGVNCATLIGVSVLQALVTVRYEGSGSNLDVYVFNNITDANPVQLFKLQGLNKGDARISKYNTILTAEVDQGSGVNSNQPGRGVIQDLFREFRWSDGAGTFVQVTFPGIFPDLTRYQAEADQEQVNQGHQPWKLDADMTSNALAVNMLKWSTSAQTTIVSGGGPHDLNAVVTVKSTSPGGGTITVTLSRLEGNANGGIWEATAVQAGNVATITAPVNRDLLTSPVTVAGTGSALGGSIGRVMILDHLYTTIGRAEVKGTTGAGNGNTTFSVNVTYRSTFHGGAEEGVVVLYIEDHTDGSIATAVMEKELLGA
jgi:hypothetical protein